MSSVDALHRRHQEELDLLENFRVLVHKRARADAQYAQELLKIQNFVKKPPPKGIDEDPEVTTVYDAYSQMVSSLEHLSAQTSYNASQLSSVLLKKVDTIIRNKRGARKAFDTTRSRVETENHQSAQDVQKSRRRYQEARHIAEDAKLKYEQSCIGGKAKQQESARKNYYKRAEQLFTSQNEYILAIANANEHEECVKKTVLPLCLDTFHERSEQMLGEWRDAMHMFVTQLDVTKDIEESFQPVYKALDAVDRVDEYQRFIAKHRQTDASVEIHQFDPSIMANCRIPLGDPGVILINDMTVMDIQQRLSKLQGSLDELTQKLSHRSRDLERVRSEMLSENGAIADGVGPPKHVQAAILTEEIEELRCKQSRQKVQHTMMQTALDAVGLTPPPALEPTSPSTMNDVPPPLPPGHHGNDAPDSGGSIGKDEGIPKFRGGTFGKKFGRFGKKKTSVAESSSAGEYLDPQTDLDHRPPPPIPGASRGTPEVEGKPVDEELWFYGEVSRRDAEQLLRKDGDYLIRLSRDKGYVLTMKWQGAPKHFVVQTTDEDPPRYRFEGESYPSIRELLEYYRDSQLPVTRRTPAVIVNPVSKVKQEGEKWSLRHDDIELGKQLGKGHFGEVWMGTMKKTLKPVAVKTCKSEFFTDKHKFLKEAEILEQYDHPNIVKLIGIAAERDPVYIVMELMPGGDFINYLRKHGPTTPTAQMLKFAVDAAEGMAYLAGKNCIHRDLAARNCLVGENDAVLKISDFGMSREEEGGMYEVSSGTKQVPIKWTAPEALNYGKYTSQSDVWSYGILLWEMFSCGSVPYPGLSNNEARDRVEMGHRLECPRGCPAEVHELMKRCWQYEPEDRPSFPDIVQDLMKIKKKYK